MSSDMHEAGRTPTPKRQNDPRDRDRSKDPAAPPSGTIPGVGWTLAAGTVDYRGHEIDTDAHPTRSMTVQETLAVTFQRGQLESRWPNYWKGTRLHWNTAEQMLRELWLARRIPGLSAEAHAQYTGFPTAEQVYDVCHAEPNDIRWAHGRLTSATATPPDLVVFDLTAAFAKLLPEHQDLIRRLVVELGR